MIRKVQYEDAKALVEIYNHYILKTIVTFETEIISDSDMKCRIKSNDPNLPWFVYEENKQIKGYAYATKWKNRSAYKHSLESTIYIEPNSTHKGIGSKLYTALLEQLKASGYHAIIGGISLPNAGSIALHEKLGFQKVAHFKEVGFKFKEWVDVGYWELVLDSKS